MNKLFCVCALLFTFAASMSIPGNRDCDQCASPNPFYVKGRAVYTLPPQLLKIDFTIETLWKTSASDSLKWNANYF